MTPRRRWRRRPPPPEPYVIEERVVVWWRDPRWIFVWLLAIGVVAALLVFLVFAGEDEESDAPAVAVPRVLGLDHVQAGARVDDAGLVADTFPVENTRPAGQVVAQAPPPDGRVGPGTTVRLEVSRGTDAAGAPLGVPNVVGLEGSEARALLRRAGLTVRTRTDERVGVDDDGIVGEQQPAAGTEVAPLDQVTIVVGG